MMCAWLQRARQQRNEAKARKAEGQRKNTKVQQITNPNTLKKMMKDKKQRKKLMTADPENAAKGHAWLVVQTSGYKWMWKLFVCNAQGGNKVAQNEEFFGFGTFELRSIWSPLVQW